MQPLCQTYSVNIDESFIKSLPFYIALPQGVGGGWFSPFIPSYAAIVAILIWWTLLRIASGCQSQNFIRLASFSTSYLFSGLIVLLHKGPNQGDFMSTSTHLPGVFWFIAQQSCGTGLNAHLFKCITHILSIISFLPYWYCHWHLLSFAIALYISPIHLTLASSSALL